MLKRFAIAAVMLGVAAPAFAAEYFIVRGPDKKCKIVESRPSDKTMIVVGDKAFMSRDEADRQLTVLCKDKM